MELLSYHLKNAGYRVRTVTDATTSIERARSFLPHLVILDIMMPELNGTQICRILRSDPEMKNVPIIFLTARGEEVDRVRGFEAGCDDYVSKPFSAKELVLRVKSNLRRAGEQEIAEVKHLQVGKIMLDLERHKASVCGRRVDFTLTEFKLLQLLMERLGHVLTRRPCLCKSGITRQKSKLAPSIPSSADCARNLEPKAHGSRPFGESDTGWSNAKIPIAPPDRGSSLDAGSLAPPKIMRKHRSPKILLSGCIRQQQSSGSICRKCEMSPSCPAPI